MDRSFTDEQRQLLQIFRGGNNIFFTGKSGTGKSYLLKKIVVEAKEKWGKEQVGITSPTGSAAQLIGGQTLHSFMGIGLGKRSRYQLLETVCGAAETRKRLERCKVLVIDEISLLGPALFEKIEFVARKIRKSSLPFGGIQVVVCGDFYQLPPVDTEVKENMFCFESPLWDATFSYQVSLSKIMRQDDPEFIAMLSEVRQGVLGTLSLHILNRCHRPIEWEGETPLKIYPRREDAELENLRMLDTLNTESVSFKAQDGGRRKEQLKKCSGLKCLTLKIGAPVILIINQPLLGLVNGSRGVVVGLEAGQHPKVAFENRTVIVKPYTWSLDDECGGVVATRKQIPLLLGWGVTIHRCQGMSIDKAEVSLHGLFCHGQAYVALSRLTSLRGLRILPNHDHCLPATDKKVVEFYTKLKSSLETPEAVQQLVDVVDIPCPRQQVHFEWEGEELPEMDTLPAAVSVVDDIIGKIEMKECLSPDVLKLLGQLTCTSSHGILTAVTSIVSYIWNFLKEIVVDHPADVTVIDKKNFMGHCKHLHQLSKCEKTVKLWCVVLSILRDDNVEIPESGPSFTQNCALMAIINQVHQTFLDFCQQGADTESLNTQSHPPAPMTHVIPKEYQGKVRYLGGWVLFKEINAAKSYIANNSGSKSAKVKSRVMKEKELLEMLKAFTSTEADIMEFSKYQASLRYLEQHNRGGLTHVKDHFYEFQLSIEKVCNLHFDKKKIDSLKWGIFKHVKEEIRNDENTRLAWERLKKQIAVEDDANMVIGIGIQCGNSETIKCPTQTEHGVRKSELLNSVFNRILKRYLNMRSKEFLKVVKREMNYQKTQAHRQKVKQRTEKRNERVVPQNLRDMAQDTSDGKMISHYTLKAMAVKGLEAFTKLNKEELHLLFHVYSLRYYKSKTKTKIIELLIECINEKDRIPHPEILSVEELQHKEKDCSRCKVQDDGEHVHVGIVDPQQPSTSGINILETSSDNIQAIAVAGDQQRQKRRKQFRPTAEQIAVLEQDNKDGCILYILETRARELSVDISQIRSWHTRYRKRQQNNS